MRQAWMSAVVVALLIGACGCKVQETLPAGVQVASKDAVNGVPAAGKPIVVDGALTEAAWKTAVAMSDFVLGRSGKPEVQCRVLVTHDMDNLYVAVINDEPATDKLVTNAKERDGNVWSDDCVEIYLDPANEKTSDYYGFFVSAANVVYDRQRVEAWDGEWKSGVTVIPGKAWVVEVAIPFKTVGVTAKVGHKLGLMVARGRRAGLSRGETLYLVPCAEEAKDTSTYPVLELK